jgi:para-aminobenzoate synthetase component 1
MTREQELKGSTAAQNNLVTLSCKPLLCLAKLKPVEFFTLIENQPWAIWLDSCYQEQAEKHNDSQFDIIVWQPEITLTTFSAETTTDFYNANYVALSQEQTNENSIAQKPTRQIKSNQLALELLKKIQSDWAKKYHISACDLPFNAGALGYFAYDLGRQLEQLPILAKQEIHCPDMAVGLYNHAIIFDHKTQQYFLSCPDHERATIEQDLTKLIASTTLIDHTNGFQLTSEWRSNMTERSYQEKFNQVQNYLLSGDCYQINLAQRFDANYTGSEFSAYLALRKANQAPFSAFMRFADQCILSVSPERFLRVKQNTVQTKPIKGTLPRAADPKQDKLNADKLLQSSKDRAENLMIVDLLRNDLSRSCVAGSVKVPSLFAIESFPAVHHLVSTVEATLSPNKCTFDLLQGAFPGGSITGAPKIRAMQIIEQLEPHRRHVYCGSIGYFSENGFADTNITIRTLICQHDKIYAWAGGGLVADSKVENEYQETFDKVNKILPILSSL